MEKTILSKIYTLIILMELMCSIVSLPTLNLNKKTWTYDLKSIAAKSSDPEKLKMNFEIVRVSRGVYAISGSALINFDIAEGDSNKIAVKSFRSKYGDNDFRLQPLQVPETHIYKMLDTHYKNVIMDSLKDCSNFPFFQNKFQPPLEKRMYTVDRCQFSQDAFPSHVEEGLYKLSLIGTGDVDWQIDIIAEVDPDF